MKPSTACKLEMLERQSRGEFGNFLQTYMNPTPLKFPHKNWYTIRNKERDSPYFIPTLRGAEIHPTISRLVDMGCYPGSIYVQDIPHPDSRRLIQGEVTRNPACLLSMTFSTHPTANLRDALTRADLAAATGSARGIMVRELALFYGGQQAWDDLAAILDRFPDEVTEFTVFDRPVGSLHRQLVVWEVRSY